MEGNGRDTYVALATSDDTGIGDHPPCCAAQGDGAAIVLCERASRLHGAGRQVSRDPKSAVREMRNAATVLGIKRHWSAEYSERRKLGSEGVAPCKRIQSSRLQWRP